MCAPKEVLELVVMSEEGVLHLPGLDCHEGRLVRVEDYLGVGLVPVAVDEEFSDLEGAGLFGIRLDVDPDVALLDLLLLFFGVVGAVLADAADHHQFSVGETLQLLHLGLVQEGVDGR